MKVERPPIYFVGYISQELLCDYLLDGRVEWCGWWTHITIVYVHKRILNIWELINQQKLLKITLLAFYKLIYYIKNSFCQRNMCSYAVKVGHQTQHFENFKVPNCWLGKTFSQISSLTSALAILSWPIIFLWLWNICIATIPSTIYICVNDDF